MTVLSRLIFFASIGALTACEISDAPSSSSATPPGSYAGSVQINGLSNFRQTALVVTDACRTTKYETDRRATAREAIDKALERYASALPGGLTVEVQSLSLRMRCHRSGLSDLESYCAADASLEMTVSGRDRGGDIKVSAAKSATERAKQGLLCISTMPAVTAAVDKALAEALVELQGGLASRTGSRRDLQARRRDAAGVAGEGRLARGANGLAYAQQ